MLVLIKYNKLYFYFNKYMPNHIYRVNVSPPAVKQEGISASTLSLQDCSEIRNLLKKENFVKLNRLASDFQQCFRDDPSCEYKIYDYFRIFEATSPEHEDLLNRWVAATPEHFAPYLARAHYHYRLAWKSRGHDYASETSEEQFKGMELHFEKASSDLNAALRIDPYLLPAYLLAIHIDTAGNGHIGVDAAYLKGKSLFPRSYLLYHSMSWAKIPRWGGSYPEMERIAREAMENSNHAPRFYTLFGEIYTDQAWAARKENKLDLAMELYSKALEYGERSSFLEERARTRMMMNDFDGALTDVDRSIALRSLVLPPYQLRANIYLKKNELTKAVAELRFMEEQFPDDADVDEWKQSATKRFLNEGHLLYKTNLDAAVLKYDTAIELDPRHAEAYYWRGMAQSKLKKPDLALADLKTAVAHNPRHFDACRMLDYQLGTEGKWDEVVGYWSRFLELEPNNADAWLERAGALKHKGDMKTAYADLNRACELGKADACKILQRENKR